MSPETRTAEMTGPSCRSFAEVWLWLEPTSPGLHLYGLCPSTLGYITASEPLGVWKQVPPLNVTFNTDLLLSNPRDLN